MQRNTYTGDITSTHVPISLQPFIEKQWKPHQDLSITYQLIHKGTTGKCNNLHSTQISKFPFWLCYHQLHPQQHCLPNLVYNHKFTTFGNEMKWYSTEYTAQGHEDDLATDAMLKFAKQLNIAVPRPQCLLGRSILPTRLVKSLSRLKLRLTTYKRLNSIMNRYKGQLIAWDIVNENLHFNFSERRRPRWVEVLGAVVVLQNLGLGLVLGVGG
ncbi:hypothetical protein EV2_035886 [Malus domestica]